MATAKHFIGHSASQAGQNCAPSLVGTHDLWDIYLAPFQAAVRDASVASIMNAYPELDGEVVAASRRILTDMLRGKLGFKGLVVSDYEAISMILNYHHAASTTEEAAALAFRAGIDVELPTLNYYSEPLRTAILSGEISLELVDFSRRTHSMQKSRTRSFSESFC